MPPPAWTRPTTTSFPVRPDFPRHSRVTLHSSSVHSSIPLAQLENCQPSTANSVAICSSTVAACFSWVKRPQVYRMVQCKSDFQYLLLTFADTSLSHRYWKFGTGSRETLGYDPAVRERLIEWYHAHYSANLMKLSVLSNRKSFHTDVVDLAFSLVEFEMNNNLSFHGFDWLTMKDTMLIDSLDELESLVTKEYSGIPNLSLAKPHFLPPLTCEELNKSISYRTIKNSPALRIEFPWPDDHHWQEKVRFSGIGFVILVWSVH